MFCSFNPNCTDFPKNCQWGKDIADPDVAGIGVVWAFGVTSLITVLCAMPEMLIGILNACFRLTSRLFSSETPPNALKLQPKLVDSIEHIILGLSDQQLITGLAILITGYTKHCSMKSRHWWVVFDLAFFSSVTHQASLLVLRNYLTKHRRFRDLRVFLMFSNYILLLVSAILSFRDYHEESKYCPIRCTFNRVRSKRFGVSPIYTVQMVLLSIVFFWQLVMLYTDPKEWHKPRSGGATDSELNAGGELLEQQLPNPATNRVNKSPERTGRGFFKKWCSFYTRTRSRYSKSYAALRWVIVMLLRPSSTIVWAFILTLWALGIRRLLWDRQWATGAENRWSFGQVLPLLLVILPFFTVVEVFQEASATEISEDKHSNMQEPQDNESGCCKAEGRGQ